ncbi:hypothetical protein BP6252_03571 [Coleophoma cylindrospora]|uniref:Hydrophobin n=1 Tax=Coleophoma cylindrospora TaxID=1849047 RepID=A0A3D8S820_9HELO|nr:hypothetical protein BP6252_03571 [Coleophoma cylindrospora]
MQFSIPTILLALASLALALPVTPSTAARDLISIDPTIALGSVDPTVTIGDLCAGISICDPISVVHK